MKYNLEPQLTDYILVKADIDKLFESITIAGNIPERVGKAMDYINTHDEINAPWLVKTHFSYPLRFEGNHRLQALRILGYKEIEVAVPNETDLSKFNWVI